MAPRKKKKIDLNIPEASKEIIHNQLIQNGLNDYMLGFGFPGGNPYSPQISQVNTVFYNLRWYMISNMRQVLSQAYVELGLLKTVVDVPVDDAFRGGITIKTKQLKDEEVQNLQAEIEQEGDVMVFAQAQKWTRLFGGAGVLLITGQDASTPFYPDSITQDDMVSFRAVDMWELYGDRQNLENGEGNLEDIHSEFYNYYGKKIHKSRVIILKGPEAPSFIRPRLRGWGYSVIESIMRSVNQYLKSNDITFEVLDEFKVDYYKLKGLANTLMAPNGQAQVRTRLAAMNQQKNYQNAVIMDSEDEFQQKQLTFSGLAETMNEIRKQVASDLRMPLTKLFGVSASGFSSGEDDIENYNCMVDGEIRAKSKYQIIKMVKIRCQQMFGFVPSDITIEFKPLRILGAEQEENVKTQKHARLLATVQAGYMTAKEFKDACNKDNLLVVQLDTSIDKLEPTGDEDEEVVEPVKAAPKSKLTPKPVKNKWQPASDLETEPVPPANDIGQLRPVPDDSMVTSTKDWRWYSPADKTEFERLSPAELNEIKEPEELDEKLWKRARVAARDCGVKDRKSFTLWLYNKWADK